jgi:hypothetical protein
VPLLKDKEPTPSKVALEEKALQIKKKPHLLINGVRKEDVSFSQREEGYRQPSRK